MLSAMRPTYWNWSARAAACAWTWAVAAGSTSAFWLDDGGMVAHPTYRLAGWHREAPWWGPYIRRRVGMRHHPLADLLNAFIRTGLVIEHVAELGDRAVPVILAIRARKRAGPP